YLLSVYQVEKFTGNNHNISISIPINLRQFFPSTSARNFFSTMTLSYTFNKDQSHSLTDVCEHLNQEFKEEMNKESIEKRLINLIKFEYNPFIRILLRPIKDFILRMVNRMNNRSITLAMSNLGRVKLPDEISAHIQQFYFYTSVIRPQFCMISYQNKLTVSFTSPFLDMDIYRQFIENLSSLGIEVTADVNSVTESELKENELL